MSAAPARVRLEQCGPGRVLVLADHGARQRAISLSIPEAAELAAELAAYVAERQQQPCPHPPSEVSEQGGYLLCSACGAVQPGDGESEAMS